jgi:hypothetical protein
MGVAIDVGNAAINRGGNWPTANYTVLNYGNPANADGVIDTVELYAVLNNNLEGCKVGIFYNISGTTYACRDYAVIGDVTGGSKQTFSGLSIDVVTGDIIGLLFTRGQFEREESGGAGIGYDAGDNMPSGPKVYTTYAGDVLSIYGTGAAADNKIIPKPIVGQLGVGMRFQPLRGPGIPILR